MNKAFFLDIFNKVGLEVLSGNTNEKFFTNTINLRETEYNLYIVKNIVYIYFILKYKYGFHSKVYFLH